jgi:hypothetical protein
MTKEDWDVIKKFRQAGYALTIFSPEELRGASTRDFENRMVELGWEVVDSLASEIDPDYA